MGWAGSGGAESRQDQRLHEEPAGWGGMGSAEAYSAAVAVTSRLTLACTPL